MSGFVHPEYLVETVTSKHQPDNESHDALKRIRKSIESIHEREVAAIPAFMSSLASARFKPLTNIRRSRRPISLPFQEAVSLYN